MSEAVLERVWRPGFVLDVPAVLGPLGRGAADPACQRVGGVTWLARNTPEGVASQQIAPAGAEVRARAWGPGARWCLDTLPALLGDADDDSGFVAHHTVIADARRRKPGLRLGATGVVWDLLVAAILEQKVTGYEAHRSWRELCRRFGTPAQRPGMFAPPTASAIRRITDWEWHRAGVDGARRRAILAAASVAPRLEEAVAFGGAAGRERLRKVPGIGPWTAAEVAQRAWGDADAVSFGDFHIPATVGWALIGRAVDDDGLAELLAPYAPQRHRAVRYVEASGFSRPRFAPRYSVRDYRAR
jgi:3-methyladenine DNA glycosylase/8-oxoguanine DNA glycosylase